MPGMGRSLQSGNPVIVSSFHSALFHQFFVILLIGAGLAIAFNVVRTVQFRHLKAEARPRFPTTPAWEYTEPAARRILRTGFGLLWVFDGLLQIQASMPIGLPSGVIQPSAGTSPGWVQHLVSSGLTIWTLHPVQAATASVWIQIGLGVWLLVAPRGVWSRLGGLAGLGWGLVVWSFGEAFGGIFAPGVSFLFGAPGAVLLYCVAGLLVALPERAWATPRLGRTLSAGVGAFFIGMAVLQAWPGRGFWHGGVSVHGSPAGTLTTMVRQMSHTPQPGYLSSWVSAFASFDAAHGWAVNLVVVVVLAASGAALCTGRRRLMLVALTAAVVLCLAVWVLVQDVGFMGGTGTDPNSMVPLVLLMVAGYVAMVRLPSRVAVPAGSPPAQPGRPWWDRLTPAYLLRAVAASGALAIVLVGTAPLSLAAANPNADPIISEALDGTPNVVNMPAPPFALTDQRGAPVSLSSLRGRTIALTFLDPVCTSDCPLIAQEFKQADEQLGGDSAKVEFVAIVANPIYRSVSFTTAFDRQEGLDRVPNWLFLTGSVAQLRAIWNSYGVLVQAVGAGAMIAHSDIAFVIDQHGRERSVLADDPGTGGVVAQSFSSVLLNRIDAARHA